MILLRDVNLTFHRRRQEVIALKGINLSIGPGEFCVLYGPSGSGKTTLLSVIAGLIRPDSGQVLVGERDVIGSSDDQLASMRLCDVGVVFQEHNLISEFTAGENVELPLRVRGVAARQASVEAEELLRSVGLGVERESKPGELSGGQRQRVGIARALIGGRKVLLADEPTGALDTENSVNIFELFRVVANSGVTVLVASHDPRIRPYADTVVTIADGRLGAPEASGTSKPAAFLS